MRYLRLFLPFILIWALYISLPYALAFMSGSQVAKYNEPLNGAQILEWRQRIQAGDFEKSCVIYLAGTSRTMADYDASLLAEIIQENLGMEQSICAHNLGNLGNSPQYFLQLMHEGVFIPEVLILEFSPEMFYRVIEMPVLEGWYEQYRAWRNIQELKVSGAIKRMLGLEASLKIQPDSIYLLLTNSDLSTTRLENLYAFWAYISFGRGQIYNPDGQVTYRSYLSDPNLLDVFENSLDTNLNDLMREYSDQPINDEEWRAFTKIIRTLGIDHVAVVRPPVSPETYSFENNEMTEAIIRMEQLVRDIGLLYIDLNPNDYSSIDRSHVDAYDTDEVTRRLAVELADWLEKHLGH
ncbi:MAG: hypothetical protein WD751_07320 [Anaerolineales bacterium]